jgi:hypothetical protein
VTVGNDQFAMMGRIVVGGDGNAVIELLNKQLDTAQKKLDETGKAAGQSGGFLGTMGKVAAGVGAGLVAGAGVAAVALNKAADTAVDFGTKVINVQRLTGLNAKSSSDAAAIMDRYGLSGRQLSTTFRALDKQVYTTNAGLSKNKTALELMGVATKNHDGTARDSMSVMRDVAEWYSKQTDKAKANTLAQQALGRGFQAMLPVMSGGAKTFDELTDAAKRNGLELSQNQIDAVKQYTKAQKDSEEVSKGLAIQTGLLVLPFKTFLQQGLMQLLTYINTNPGFAKFKAWLGDATQGAIAFGKGAIQWFGSLKPYWDALITTGRNLWTQMQGLWTKLAPVFEATGRIVVSLLVPAFRDIWTAAQNMWTALQPLLPLLKFIALVVGGVLVAALLGAVIALAAVFRAAAWLISTLWNLEASIVHFVTSAVQGFVWFVTNVPKLLAELPATIAYLIGFAMGWLVKKTVEGIEFTVDYWAKMPGRIMAFVTALPGMLASALKWLWDTDTGWIVKIVDWTIDYWKKLPGELYNVVVSLPKIMWDGLVSLGKAAVGIGSAIWNGFKAGMGIHSPSFIEQALDGIVKKSGDSLGTMQKHVAGFNRIALGGAPRLAIAGGSNIRTSTTETHDHYHLTINTGASAESVLQDYNMMKSMNTRGN